MALGLAALRQEDRAEARQALEAAIELEPQNAFGDYDDRLLFLEPRHLLPEHIEEGMGFEGLPEGCNPAAPKDRLYFISDIYPDHVVLDGNHPLAGIALRLTITVRDVREASDEELEARSVGVDVPTILQGGSGAGRELH